MPGMTWRWKNFSPLMPLGARKIEQGLPSICGNNHSPTASKYSARSRFVTGALSPASGHSALSDLVMAIPKTNTVAELVKRDDRSVARLFSLPGGAPLPEKGLVDAATAFNSGMMRFTTLAL